MTKEELKKKLRDIDAEIAEKEADIHGLRLAQDRAKEKYCEAMTEKYSEFTGKRVRIHWEKDMFAGRIHKTIDGFFVGFYINPYTIDLYPKLHKVTSSGHCCSVTYDDWQLPKIDQIVQIEIC